MNLSILVPSLLAVSIMFLFIDDAHAIEIDISEKFDPGFYDRIQTIVDKRSAIMNNNGSVPVGASMPDDSYNVIIYITRYDSNSTIQQDMLQNKQKIVEILNEIGAKDIIVAQSLSFITATVPIGEISRLAAHDIVYQLGDGEEQIEAHVDKAKKLVLGKMIDIPIYNEQRKTGNGIVVSVIDSGINSKYLNDKVTKRIYCPNGTCTVQDGLFHGPVLHDLGILNGTNPTTHGTRVAQIIAASGMSKNNGIAPGVTLLDALHSIEYHNSRHKSPYQSGSAFVHTLDWSYTQGADVINISSGSRYWCNPSFIPVTLNIIVDEIVEKGVVFVTSAGNRGLSETNRAQYNTVTAFSCAHNSITVGGIDGRNSNVKMYQYSSRGPSNDKTPILKPDLVAPAVHFNLLDSSVRDSHYVLASGTSFASPLVAGTVALMLDGNTHLEPRDVKALLLLGANWTGPIPCTSKQFEQNNPLDNCSFARQPTNKNTANGKDGLKILNNVGFGILNTKQAVQYANQPELYVIDQITSQNKTKTFTINITDTSKPVKIILNWLVEPPDINKKRIKVILFPVIDLNLNVKCANGQTFDATSRYQTTEFVVFQPTAKGKCDITVTAPDTGRVAYFDFFNFRITNMQQDFTIASTVPFVDTETLTTSLSPIRCEQGTRLADGQCVPSTPSPPVQLNVLANNSASTPPQDNQIIQITIPQSDKFDNTGRTIDLYHGIDDRMRIDTYYAEEGTSYHINNKAYITMFRDTWITNKQFDATGGQYCYVGDLEVGQDPDISTQHTTALNIQFRKSTDSARCVGSPDISLDGKLSLDKEVYVRFVAASGQNPFYHDGSSIVKVLECTDSNFNSNTNELTGNTEICYGKDGNDVILVSKILTIFGVTNQDLSSTVQKKVSSPPLSPPVQTVNPMTQLSIHAYAVYDNIINGNYTEYEKIGTVHKFIPKCAVHHSPITQSVKLSSNGDLHVRYSSNGDFDGGTIFTTIKDDSKTFRAISSDPTLISSTTNKFEYTNVIPNNIIDTGDDHLTVRSFFFINSNTIESAKVYSNNSNGVPLFYKGSESIAVQLPSAVNGTTFVSGNLDGLDGTVYLPSSNSITLNEEILCKFGNVKPNNVAKIFDLNLTVKNATGLEFTYKFKKQTFQSGDDIVKEVKPNKLYWIVTSSDNNTIYGNTTKKISNKFTFEIPLVTTNVYDVLIYGTSKQQGKILGVYQDSIKFSTKESIDAMLTSLQKPPKVLDPTNSTKTLDPVEVIQITIPEHTRFDNTGRTIDLYSGVNNQIRIDTHYSDVGTAYYTNDVADIIIFRDNWITGKSFTANGGQYCYVGDLQVGSDPVISKQHTTTLNIQFGKSTKDDRCNGSPDIDLDGKLSLTKEIYVRFIGTNGQVPFYYDGSNTVDISKCTDTNFNETTNQLIGNTEICYGKDGNDAILVSKILTTFGV